MKKIAFFNIGCRTNVAEIEEWILNLDSDRYVVDTNNPDVIILNTCAVTTKAGAKSRTKYRELEKKFPNATLLPVGCAVDNGDFKNIELALKNIDKQDIVKKFGKNSDDLNNTHYRARYNLLIQLGCNSSCSYCIIPTLRGKEHSLNFDEIIIKAKQLIKSGVKEIVLSGTNIGRYNFKGKRLFDLMEELLKIPDSYRLRLSSIEAWDFDKRIIDLATKDSRICSFFHIPIQSGSQKVLKDMNRLYSLDDYKELVGYIKSKLPDAMIGSDIIVGFPTETNELFEETYNFLKNIEVNHYHVFPYSPRKGTYSYNNFKDSLTNKEKKDRVLRLINLGKDKKNIYLQRFIGKKLSIVVEKILENKLIGKSDNFIDCEVEYSSEISYQLGDMVHFRVLKIEKDRFIGEVELV